MRIFLGIGLILLLTSVFAAERVVVCEELYQEG
jgi:hypothetical protein